jgi:hypothetical protein
MGRSPRYKSRAHAGMQLRLAIIGYQDRTTAQDINKFFLGGMSMMESRLSARCQEGKIEADMFKTEYVTQATLGPAEHAAGKRCGVIGRPVEGPDQEGPECDKAAG